MWCYNLKQVAISATTKTFFMTTLHSLKSTLFFLIGIACMGWTACKPATPPDPNEEELITRCL